MKEPGDQELPQYHVGDPMVSTGLIAAGIVGSLITVFSVYFYLYRSRPPSVLCLLLSAPTPRMYQSGD